MNKPMIENSDRGVTLNKSLAWAIICGLIGAGLWVGLQVQAATSGIQNLSDSIAEIKADATTQQAVERQRRTEVDARLRVLETTRAADATEISALRRDLTDFRKELREAVSVLRAMQR